MTHCPNRSSRQIYIFYWEIGTLIYVLSQMYVCVYIPPPFYMEVLKSLSQLIANHPCTPVLVLGDFNNVLDTSLDFHKKFCSQGPKSPTAFARLISEIGLTDLLRCKLPHWAQFSCPFLNTFHPFTHRRSTGFRLNSLPLDLRSLIWLRDCLTTLHAKLNYY